MIFRGCALYVNERHVVLEIPYVIKNQYSVTRCNKKGPIILFVNKEVSLKMHLLAFKEPNIVQVTHTGKYNKHAVIK